MRSLPSVEMTAGEGREGRNVFGGAVGKVAMTGGKVEMTEQERATRRGKIEIHVTLHLERL